MMRSARRGGQSLGSVVVMTVLLLPVAAPQSMAKNPEEARTNSWRKVMDDGAYALVVGKIKVAYADRKDIPGRLIRVRYDGTTVQLAGFVPSKDAGEEAARIAREIAKPEDVITHWTEDATIAADASYRTYVGEQTEDALLKAKVVASLNGPAVVPQFKKAEILHVQVARGAVVVYVVADEATKFDLDPYVKPIPGVTSLTIRVVNAF